MSTAQSLFLSLGSGHANFFDMASAFANALRQAFPGLTVTEIGRKTGMTQPTTSRILKGGKPGLENVLRVSYAAGDHPAKWMELAGYEKEAFILRKIFPREGMESDRPRAPGQLHQMLDNLFARGLGEEASQALRGLESRWAFVRPYFDQLVEESRASAACLIADHRIQGDVLVCVGCDKLEEGRLAHAAGSDEVEGWQLHRHQAGELTLRLFLKNPHKKLKKADLQAALVMWASGLRGVWGL